MQTSWPSNRCKALSEIGSTAHEERVSDAQLREVIGVKTMGALTPKFCYNSKSAAKKAKKPPTTNAATLIHHKTQPIRRSRLHAFALAGSAGHGRFLACHCQAPDAANTNPAIVNTIALLAPIQVIPGTASIKPAITAPMPTLTNSAGSAQQISVDNDVNSASVAGRTLGGFMSVSRLVMRPHARRTPWRNPIS